MAEKKNNATKNDVEAAQTAQKIPKSVKKPLDKFGRQEVFIANDDTEYTFQFPGTRRAQEILDESKNGYGVVVDSVYYERIMREVIVEPNGLNLDYWDEHEGYREVMNAADNFLGRLLN
ncbi:TPA: hypothetical protein RD852_000743 [Listeria monocytogenes]|uniref:hypothetical protein n=1 Tax=Listeria monocytogenes TaxID=1639 RepID=UPI0010E1E420|nr:hypothetical protein [Listeria monocytogenes]EAE3064583.1 hypothetical protein [Listeria monocytogenes]ECL0334297.1 hypothetical protein [Listeria monocytogenes]EDN8094777.1 hypothetical protein [Listeria monocytogenes]EDP7876453.1 hypothetical protein [Listeria monocytogenes]EHE7936885.1 hypothetical protein [Listeria monocytogenes]